MTFRRGLAYLPTIAAVGAVVALGGCTTHHQAGARAGSTPAPSGTGQPPAAVVTDGPGVPASASGSPTSGDGLSAGAPSAGGPAAAGGVTIGVRFAGSTSCRRAADGPLLFDLTVTNSGPTDHHDIAPLVVAHRYPGGVGPLHVLAATLERQDPANGTWQEVPMPAGADTPTLQHDWPTVSVAAHNTTVLHYRLIPRPEVGAGTAHLTFYALGESVHRALDETTQLLCFA